MGVTSALRSELKRRVLPLAEAQGFVVDERKLPQSIEFRRTAGDAVHVFGIQWEKYGKPRFAVHYGTLSRSRPSVGPDLLPPRDVLVSWLADAGSLQPRRGILVAGVVSPGSVVHIAIDWPSTSADAWRGRRRTAHRAARASTLLGHWKRRTAHANLALRRTAPPRVYCFAGGIASSRSFQSHDSGLT